MSLIRFTTDLGLPATELPGKLAEQHDSEANVGFSRDLHTDYRLSVDGVAPFPNNNGRTHAQLMDFFLTHGMSGTVLYKALLPFFREVAADPALDVNGATAGNSTGASGELFYTRHKYIHHVNFFSEDGITVETTSTLKVYVGGVLQTLTTDYTFAGNGTAPVITTTATFDAGVVTFDYEFYHSVRFTAEPVPAIHRYGQTLADPGVLRVRISLREDKARGRLTV